MGYETEIVHPAMAKWLAENGYAFVHEYDTGDGRIDFLATRPDGHNLIVECKASASSIQSTVMQVVFYCRLMGNGYSPAIAIPGVFVTPAAREKTARLNIVLIELDVADEEKKTDDTETFYTLRVTTGFIRRWHGQYNTCPYGDFSEVIARACLIFPDNADDFRQQLSDWLIRTIIDNKVVWSDPPHDGYHSWFASDECKKIYPFPLGYS